jgi:hypothetical protein
MMLQWYHHDVRTTITLDEDTAERIQEEMRQSGRSFKDTVNEAIRIGLSIQKSAIPAGFKIAAKPLGVRPGISYDNIGELLEQLEGPLHR